MKITIVGWKEGFAKVSFNKFLRKNFGYSIAKAKLCVDEILIGKNLELLYVGSNQQSVAEELARFDLEIVIEEQ